MLAIRMQRTGRSGHAQFRMIVQDSRFSPSRGRVVAYLGSYDPHTKESHVDTEAAGKYLANGAQPSDRAARLLQKEGVKLPSWVKISEPKNRSIRNPEKLRRNRPAEPEAPAAEAQAEEPEVTETPAEQASEAPAENEAISEEAPVEEPVKPDTEAAEETKEEA